MATVYWTANGQNTAQVTTFAVSGATAADVYAIFDGNLHELSYTVQGGDTDAIVANALLSLINGANAPTEFADANWAAASGTLTATAAIPGTPYTFTSSITGSGTFTQTTVTANTSQNDVANVANWSSGSLPVSTDVIILQNTDQGLLWNLDALDAVLPASLTTWNNFTGNVGLTDINQNGQYIEYRPKYLKINNDAGGDMALKVGIGQGQGSGLFRIACGAGKVTGVVQNTASPVTGSPYAFIFTGTHAANSFTFNGGTNGLGMDEGEVVTIASAGAIAPASLALGAGVTFSGTLTLGSVAAEIRCTPAAIVTNGATLSFAGASTLATLTMQESTVGTYLTTATVTNFTLSQGSTMDYSQDDRARTITTSTIDGDCVINDPWNTVTFTNATTVRGAVTSGPFIFGPGRTVKVA